MKKEYSKLHERYTELFKTHMDYMERTKILMGSTDRIDVPGRGRLGPVSLAQLSRYVYRSNTDLFVILICLGESKM